MRPCNVSCFYRYAEHIIIFNYNSAISYRNLKFSDFLVALKDYSWVFACAIVNPTVFPSFWNTQTS